MSGFPSPPGCAEFCRREGTGPYVLAEIGVNHGGDLDLARRLVDEAAEGGADAVKFQTYKAGKLASRNSPSYWDLDSEPTRSQYELFKRYDGFETADYEALARHAVERGVDFLSTPFDLEAVEALAPLMRVFKVASADLTNVPLLDAVAAHGKPVLLSTGAAHLSEVDEAVRRLTAHLPPERIGLLHCVLEYPTPFADAHLATIEHLQRCFPDHPVGYSDHTRPDAAMLVLLRAWMLGATVLEKHFTHDKNLPGNDHYHAMDRDDLRRLREGIALLEQTEGEARVRALPGEEAARRNARRSLVASRALASGHVLEAGDLDVKRPAFGLPPSALDWVLGRPLRRDLAQDDFLTFDHLLDD